MYVYTFTDTYTCNVQCLYAVLTKYGYISKLVNFGNNLSSKPFLTVHNINKFTNKHHTMNITD